MFFKDSRLQNFRGFEKLELIWSPEINLILGSNGSGKTNTLESLSILSGWGGFANTRNLISWSNPHSPAYMSANISGEEDFKVTAKITNKTSIQLDGKKITCTDLRVKLPAVTFLTGGINLIDGTPAARRLFLDKLCALIFPPYAKLLSDFKLVNKARINLLRSKRPANSTTLLFCKTGGYIMEIRREIISQLKNFMNGANNFNIAVMPELENFSGAEFLYNSLKKNREREIFAQRPLSGVNYDDLIFTVNNKPASEFLSRGQKRMLILDLIIIAGNLIYSRLRRKPVLFFDDLTAELDKAARENVLSKLKNTGWQIFLTAPENPFNKKFKFGGINFSVSR